MKFSRGMFLLACAGILMCVAVFAFYDGRIRGLDDDKARLGYHYSYDWDSWGIEVAPGEARDAYEQREREIMPLIAREHGYWLRKQQVIEFGAPLVVLAGLLGLWNLLGLIALEVFSRESNRFRKGSQGSGEDNAEEADTGAKPLDR